VQQVNSSKEEDRKLFVVRKMGEKLPIMRIIQLRRRVLDASVME
jgi:hypothetical protein